MCHLFFFSDCIRPQLSTLLPVFGKTWQTGGHGENVRVISWLRACGNILPQIHNRQPLHKPLNQYLSISATYTCDGKKYTCAHIYVNMRFLPPFALCCLGCGQNIYEEVVRVIYPHKASAALWKRCKYGTWLAPPSPLSFSCSLQRWVNAPPIRRIEILWRPDGAVKTFSQTLLEDPEDDPAGC